MPAIFAHRIVVSERAIDGQGHVNNLEYLRWMQDAAVAHSAKQGWDTARYVKSGAGWVVRSHWIEYLQSALLDDQITVFTWVASFQKIRSLRKYRIVREKDAAILATAETDWVFIGLKHRVPRRVPSELINAFEVVTDDAVPLLVGNRPNRELGRHA